MDTLPGAIGLLAGAVSYMLGVCAPLGPGDMALPTPCPHWDLARLLSHLCESMADLEAALRTGRLDLDGPPGRTGGNPVEALRDRAAELLCAGYCYGGPERFVTVDGLPIPAGVVACTGAVEIAVHGWDVSAARARAGRGRAGGEGDVQEAPIPAALATRMLRLGRCSWPAGRGCSASRSRFQPRPARVTGWLVTWAGTRVPARCYWRVI